MGQNLKKEKDNFEIVFETAPIGMLILNEAGKIKLANKYFLSMANKGLLDVVDKSIGQGIACVQTFKKDNSENQICNYCKIRKSINESLHKEICIVDLIIQHSIIDNNKQRNVWVKLNLTPITILEEKQILLAIEDITNQKEHEEMLKKYQALFENARDIIIFMDMDGRIIEANESAIKTYGYSHEELLTLSIYDLRKDSKFVGEQMEKAYDKGIFFESVHTRKDGTTLPVEVSSKGTYIEGKRMLASIIRDISERKDAEAELKKAKEEAEKGNKSKSEFLANMSHEIRTPLNGMLGMIDLTLLTELDAEQRENILTAKHCANSLLNIINDILDFSKMEVGKLEIEDLNFNIREMMENTIKTHAHYAKKKRLDLNYSFSATVPTYLKGDPNRLQQILNNLISNAIKFTKSGEVSISIKGNTNDNNNDNIELKFAVVDTGIGISDEDINRLFKVFSQLDGSYTKKHSGTGLGLAISKRLVDMMGGDIWAESEKGKGSAFYFTLKFEKGEEIKKVQRFIPMLEKSINPKRILLAEDDKVNQTVLARMLTETGHSVDIANDGDEAISMYKQKEYDIILMDIQMPVMDGIEATKQIRAMEDSGAYTPIIAITAFALHGDREKFLSNGIDEYISKPVQMEELFYIIDTISEKRKCSSFILTGIPQIDDNGNIIFVDSIKKKSVKELAVMVDQIENQIELLEEAIKYNDYTEIEAIAHEIKNLAVEIDAEQLKNAAFKIELSTRRGNLGQTMKSIAYLLDEFATYRKTIL